MLTILLMISHNVIQEVENLIAEYSFFLKVFDYKFMKKVWFNQISFLKIGYPLPDHKEGKLIKKLLPID